MKNFYLRNKVKLSEREIEVLTLTAKEFTGKEIAKSLFISLPTVETHKRNLFEKLDVRNAAGMIRKSFELGILSIDLELMKTIVSCPNGKTRMMQSPIAIAV